MLSPCQRVRFDFQKIRLSDNADVRSQMFSQTPSISQTNKWFGKRSIKSTTSARFCMNLRVIRSSEFALK